MALSTDLFMQKMIANDVAVLYGGTVQKHNAFTLDIPYGEQTKAMGKDSAYVKNGMKSTLIKVVQGE